MNYISLIIMGALPFYIQNSNFQLGNLRPKIPCQIFACYFDK